MIYISYMIVSARNVANCQWIAEKISGDGIGNPWSRVQLPVSRHGNVTWKSCVLDRVCAVVKRMPLRMPVAYTGEQDHVWLLASGVTMNSRGDYAQPRIQCSAGTIRESWLSVIIYRLHQILEKSDLFRKNFILYFEKCILFYFKSGKFPRTSSESYKNTDLVPQVIG